MIEERVCQELMELLELFATSHIAKTSQQPRLENSLPCSSLAISGGEVTLIVSGENWSTRIKRSSFSLREKKMAD